MIRNIILDMGNVLLDYNPEVILEKTLDNEEDRQIIRKELFGGPEWVQGDFGIIKNSERFDGVSQRVPSRLHPALRECVENWDICMVPVEGAVDFCRFPLEWFDGIVVSSDEHIVKPDAGIYRILLERYGLNADECLFIDDRADNVRGAVESGMNAYVFNNDFETVKSRYGL